MASRLDKASDIATVQWPATFESFERLATSGVALEESHLATIAYRAADYKRAVQLWERGDPVAHQRYHRAKADTTPFPGCIEFLKRLNDHEEILRQWARHAAEQKSVDRLDDDVLRAVANAAIERKDLRTASRLVRTRPDRDQLRRLLEAAEKADDHDSARAGVDAAGRFFVQTGAWTDAVKLAELDLSQLVSGRTGKKIRSICQRAGGSNAALRVVASELAVSEELSNKQPAVIIDFLNRHFVDGSAARTATSARRYGLSPKVAGAAIERAGKIVDAVKYYERLFEESAGGSELRLFSAERLTRNLERHAEYYRHRNDTRQARSRESRARALRRQEGIGDRAISSYRVVEAMNAGTEAVATLQFGPFEIVRSRLHGRLRIEHGELFETVTVDMRGRTLRGDAHFSEMKSATREDVSWNIAGWNMTVKLSTERGNPQVQLQFDGKVFEASLNEGGDDDGESTG